MGKPGMWKLEYGIWQWKMGVQIVFNYPYNLVDTLPHLPHLLVQTPGALGWMSAKPRAFATVVRAKRTAIYTGKIGNLPQVIRWLSPVSTAPTITTTTYI